MNHVRYYGEPNPKVEALWKALTWLGLLALVAFDAYVLWWLFR